jgi:tol-pal system protein YbgF
VLVRRLFVWIQAIGLLAGCVTPTQFYALQHDVEALQGKGGGSDSGSRVAELSQELEALREQLAELRGQLEETRHLAEQALGEAEAIRRTPAAAGESTPGAGAGPGRAGELAAVAPPATGEIDEEVPSGGADREVQDYEAAFRLYRSGDYSAAVERFQAFVQAHPQSDYADNALFWMGECHQKLGDFVLAAVTFERVHKEFPNGNKVPDALYRQAIALIEIGRQKGERVEYESAAREVLQRIIDEHPRSERVDEARTQLQKLSR